MLKKGFPPITDEWATVLILGTMPGEESLRKNEYYGNIRNSFWRIMARLLDFEYDVSYKEKTKILKKNKIALWDVIYMCKRQGSLDSMIIDNTITQNDFTSFYRSHPSINHLFFNGAKAEKEYLKNVFKKLPDEAKTIKHSRLPSTSPAMARLSFDAKLLAWSCIMRKT